MSRDSGQRSNTYIVKYSTVEQSECHIPPHVLSTFKIDLEQTIGNDESSTLGSSFFCSLKVVMKFSQIHLFDLSSHPLGRPKPTADPEVGAKKVAMGCNALTSRSAVGRNPPRGREPKSNKQIQENFITTLRLQKNKDEPNVDDSSLSSRAP